MRVTSTAPPKSSQCCYTLAVRVPTQRVRELRRTQTDSEKAAWYRLRDRRLGAKFRRQCRIENWVVDFYCFEHIDWRSSLMAACTRSPAQSGKTLRKRII